MAISWHLYIRINIERIKGDRGISITGCTEVVNMKTSHATIETWRMDKYFHQTFYNEMQLLIHTGIKVPMLFQKGSQLF